MGNHSIDPPDVGQRIRRKDRQRLVHVWMRRILRNRSSLVVVLWAVKTAVQIARLIFDGS